VDNLITTALSGAEHHRNYTVTDKADGERRLLLVSSNTACMMIDTNMNVYFTGMVADNAKTHKSILTGVYKVR
jgi:hypothetical protein